MICTRRLTALALAPAVSAALLLNTAPTARLMAWAEARSCPRGFSSTTRTAGWLSPAAPSCSQMTGKT